MMNQKKGFTLIEMLVVIAVIAVLVSVVIPTVGESTNRAKAATDAANLRSTLGSLNSEILLNQDLADSFISAMEPSESKLYPGAKLYVLYVAPALVDVYYVDGSHYYGLRYLSDYASTGSSTVTTSAPTLVTEHTWYEVGFGQRDPANG